MKKAILIVIVLAFYSCDKLMPPNISDQKVATIHDATVVSFTDTGCILKLRYAVRNNNGLLDSRLFQFDNSSGNIAINETARNIVSEQGGNYSILVLVDKSFYDGSTNMIDFENSLFNCYVNNTGYEINFAGFGNDSLYPGNIEFLSNSFENNITGFSIQNLGPLFNNSLFKNNQNTMEALDSGLNFIAANAKYPSRLIFLYTNGTSDIDSASLISIKNKANTLNTKLCIYNTEYQNDVFVWQSIFITPDLFTKSRLCNDTKGFYFSDACFDLQFNEIDKIMHSASMYESTFRLTCDTNFFSNTWCLITFNIICYDNTQILNTILYEHP